MNFELLGKRVREERMKLRMSQQQLAEAIDRSVAMVGQVERAECKIKVETLVRIANALGTTIDYLLRDSIDAKDDNISAEMKNYINEMDKEEKIYFLNIMKLYSDLKDKQHE